jgi:tetratricopeptide (TPR) repeat protein
MVMSLTGIALVAAAVMILSGRPAVPDAAAAPTVAVAEAPAVSLAGAVTTSPAPMAVSMDLSRAAVAAYGRGDIAGSLEQFRAAVDAAPNNPDALNQLGQVLVRDGQPREAIQYFDRAIALVGTTWAYHFNRARALTLLKAWAPAIAGYRDAVRLFPDDYVTAFNLARALQESGDLTGAIAEFERAIALAPGDAEFHLSHAYALEQAQRPRDAAAAYRRYLELQEGAPQAEKIQARITQLEGTPLAAAAPPTVQ